MRQVTTFIAVMLFSLGLAEGERAAEAHPTGTELRNAQQCSALQGPLRGHCLECVARPRPHHFHPEAAAGQRCRPDNGQP